MYNQSGLFVMQLIHREARLHAKWHEIKQSAHPPTTRRDLAELLQAALDLSQKYQAWEKSIPPVWRYEMAPNTPEVRATYDERWQRVLSSRGAPEEIHSYSNLKICWVWGFYRTSRMFLLRDLLEMLNWMFRLPEVDPVAVAPLSPNFASPFPLDNEVAPVTFDSLALRTHHASATLDLVHLIKKSCSAILGSFTVPVYGKSYTDVMGMRGYVNLWPLGIMDAVLRSGLVPDSQSPPAHRTAPPHASPAPVPDVLSMNMHAPYPTPAYAPPHPDAVKLEDEFLPNASLPSYTYAKRPVPKYNPAAPKTHIFDSSAPHPYDHPVPQIELDGAATIYRSADHSAAFLGFEEINACTPAIDVAARREWLNAMLYYAASRLGIKKGLYVPLTEGLLPVVRGRVDGWDGLG